MEVSTSYALEQARERFAQLRQQLASQTTQQRLTDMSGLKPVENAPLPALAQLRWPAMDVEHSREMLGGTQARRDLTNQSIEDCSKSIKTAEALIAKYGPISPLCAMMESAKSALQSYATRRSKSTGSPRSSMRRLPRRRISNGCLAWRRQVRYPTRKIRYPVRRIRRLQPSTRGRHG